MESETSDRKRETAEIKSVIPNLNRFFIVFSVFTFILGVAFGSTVLPYIGVQINPKPAKMTAQQLFEFQQAIGVIVLFLAIPVSVVTYRILGR